ncbi:MAG TPA: MBL fold metallo-hydrolase, partial [Jatrophihabitans sp.]|nr:MBL fold metallo-hydrolase [Jatrophihabitans sp.]
MLVGDIDVHPVSDGTFRASPAYFGEHARPDGHEDLFTAHGMAWLPIGCFLVRTGDRTILVDAGMGPAMRDDGPRRLLIGGQLLLGLRAVGVTPAQVTDVVCTHLHADHCGWLFDRDAAPVFAHATIWFGAHDWDHFVPNHDVWMFDHIRHGFRGASEQGDQLRPLSGD